MKVINLRKDKYTVYIGRGSIFGNPFKIDKTMNRQEVIDRYEEYIRYQLSSHYNGFTNRLISAIGNLSKDAILGCYCKPKACHGDVIIKIWKELNNNG